MIKKIVVPLDGSKFAEKALPTAKELAHSFEAELTLVWVMHPLVVMSDYGASTYGKLIEMESVEAKNYLAAVQTEMHGEGISAKTTVLDGQPAEQIIGLACDEKADMIVMTTHGRSGLSRWVHGSVATKVLRQSPCPVLLVRNVEAVC